ncbi:MAG: AAA family ATPase [Desulfobacterales bacterium]|nr:AAA family ATPase [Desulfobacterales bacterium]
MAEGTIKDKLDQLLKDNIKLSGLLGKINKQEGKETQIGRWFWLRDFFNMLNNVSIIVKIIVNSDRKSASLTQGSSSITWKVIKNENNIDDFFSIAKDGNERLKPEDQNMHKNSDLLKKLIRILLGASHTKDTYNRIERFRITTNSYLNIDSNIVNTIKNPDAHFLTNNYLFYIVQYCLKIAQNEAQNISDLLEEVKFVCCFPSQQFYLSNNFEKNNKTYITKIFQPKFLWMWSTKANVLRFPSLYIFGRFCGWDFFKGKALSQSLLKDYIPTPNNENHSIAEWSKDGNLAKQLVELDMDKFAKAWETISQTISQTIVKNGDPSQMSQIITYLLDDDDYVELVDFVQHKKAVILSGPPGSGKTHAAKEVIAKQLLRLNYSETLESRLFDKNDTYNNYSNGAWNLIQFHPSYAYEDFIGGIRPNVKNGEQLNFTVEKGSFLAFCIEANKFPEKKFVFIIDEINRANLSAVFGELLYALEYRGEEINIPNFRKFSIPPNVYLIGTMNNLDKSLSNIDYALRRRFSFYDFNVRLIDLNVMLDKMISEDSITELIKRAEKLNEMLSAETKDGGLKLSKEHQIGQAYFKKIADYLETVPSEASTISGSDSQSRQDISPAMYSKLWKYDIEPLLREYLGSQYDKEAIKKNVDNMREMFVDGIKQDDKKAKQ